MAKLKGHGYSLEDLENYGETHKRKSALEIFTDRDEPRDVFWRKHYNPLSAEMEKGETQSEIHAIHFYGTAGVGKSTLLKKIADELGNRPFLLVDFRGFQGGKREAVVKIAIEIQEKFHFPMPFTAAADAWWAYLQRDTSKLSSPEKKTKEKMESNKFVGAGLYLLGFTPFGGVVGNVIDFVDYLETNYGINLSKSVKDKFSNKDIRRIQDEIKACDIQELDKRFHIYFGFDLTKFVSTLRQPLVIMFDTYEHFINPLGIKETYRSKDLWLRNETDGLVYNMSNVVWILAGREKLGSIDDEKRKDSWDRLDLDEHRIGPLSQEDSEKYLDSVGITDKGLRDYIVDISKGSPLHLDLCYARYNDLKGQEGRLDPASYADTIDSAIERFLERMTPEFVEFVETMSAFRDGWTDDMIDGINQQIPGFNLNLYNTLLRQNSMVMYSQFNKRYMLEDNLQRVMYSKIAPNIAKKVNEAILMYYKDETDLTGNYSCENALRLSRIVINQGSVSFADFRKYAESMVFDLIFSQDSSSAFDILALYENSKPYEDQADYSLYVAVSSLTAYIRCIQKGYLAEGESFLPVYDTTGFGMCDNIAKCFCYFALAQQYRFVGMVRQSVDSINKCLDIASANFTKDNSFYLLVLREMAKTYVDTGEYRKALEYAQLYYDTIKQEKENKLAKFNALLSIAEIYHRLGDFKTCISIQEGLLNEISLEYGKNSFLSSEVKINLAIYLGDMGEYQKALDMRKTIYEKRKKIFGERDLKTIEALSNLASSYRDVGEYQKALNAKKVVYNVKKEVLGKHHLDTIKSLSNLAISYSDVGEYKTALNFEEKVYCEMKDLLGKFHLDTILVYGNLAKTYWRFGDYQKAYEARKSVYEARKEILGVRHPDTISALAELACSYDDIGENQKALEARKKVYEASKEKLGEHHPNTLIALNDLAFSYGFSGEYQKALEIKEKVYDDLMKKLGNNHPFVVMALDNLACSYNDLGEYKKAFYARKNVYTARKRLLGEEHPDTLSSLGNLAMSYRDIGEYQKALEIMKKVYESMIVLLGKSHPNTIYSFNNLAVLYRDANEYQNALDAMEKVYNTLSGILGECHPDVIMTLNNLAFSYSDAGEYQKAYDIREKVYKTRKETLGYRHPDTISALGNLAISCREIGEYDEALNMTLSVYDTKKEMLGQRHPDTLIELSNIAGIYRILGEYQKAIGIMENAYSELKNVLGENHPNTIDALLKLAILYIDVAKYKKALNMVENVYNARKQMFGESHPGTIKTKELLDKLKRYQDGTT